MVGKIYSQLEYLTAEQAISYLCFLIDVKADAAIDVLIDYANQGVLDFYCDFSLGGLFTPIVTAISFSYGDESGDIPILLFGYQKHLSGYRLGKEPTGYLAIPTNIDGETTSVESGGVYAYFKGSGFTAFEGQHIKRESVLEFMADLGLGKVDILVDPIKGGWESNNLAEDYDPKLGGMPSLLSARVGFLRADVEALAAKMNDEPAHQALQVKNQRLQKEVDALKTTVERLQAENAQLKAGASVSDEINPRKEGTLYRLIIGMAQMGYRYDPKAPKNSAVSDIYRDLDQLGIGLGETTIRNHLNAAKAYLPTKPIKT